MVFAPKNPLITLFVLTSRPSKSHKKPERHPEHLLSTPMVYASVSNQTPLSVCERACIAMVAVMEIRSLCGRADRSRVLVPRRRLVELGVRLTL